MGNPIDLELRKELIQASEIISTAINRLAEKKLYGLCKRLMKASAHTQVVIYTLSDEDILNQQFIGFDRKETK